MRGTTHPTGGAGTGSSGGAGTGSSGGAGTGPKVAQFALVTAVPLLFVLVAVGVPLPITLTVLAIGWVAAYVLRRDISARTQR